MSIFLTPNQKEKTATDDKDIFIFLNILIRNLFYFMYNKIKIK